MIKINILLLLIILCSKDIQAQFKLNINGGLNTNLNAKNDTVALAAKNGTAFSIKPSYSIGRVMLAMNITTAKHNTINATEAVNRFTFDSSYKITSTPATGLSNISVFIGPELCICFKTIKIIPSIKVGVVQTKIKEYAFDINRPQSLAILYIAQQQTNTNIGIQTGLQFGYKINKYVSISLQSELTSYTTTSNIRDSRRANTAQPKDQKFNFLKIGTGFTYNF